MNSRLASGLLALALGALVPLSIVSAQTPAVPDPAPGATQKPDESPAPSKDATAPDGAVDETEPEIHDGKLVLGGIEFLVGPCTGKLGDQAEVSLPERQLFTDGDGARRVLEMSQNLTSGRELGMVMIAEGKAQVFFEFKATGYVKDDEKDKLDADALLDTYKEGIENSNEERKRRGWEPLELVGWHKAPFYDPKTNNLTWALLLRSSSGESINWSTRLLGRGGTMDVDLVLSPEELDHALPEFEKLLDGFHYVAGKTYGEFRSGDKIAEYGLAALVAGGAGAVAFKTGLLAKFWKFILIGLVAVGAWFKRLFGFGKKDGERNAST